MVEFNNSGFKRNTFGLWDFQLRFSGSSLEISFIMTGAVTLTFAGTLVLLGIYKFIRFFAPKSIQGFLHTGLDKVFGIMFF